MIYMLWVEFNEWYTFFSRIAVLKKFRLVSPQMFSHIFNFHWCFWLQLSDIADEAIVGHYVDDRDLQASDCIMV